MIHEKRLLSYIKILSCIGILLSIYLLWQQIFRPAFQPCSINSWVNCDAIVSGPVAYTWGIRTPLIGLTGYIVIFFSALFVKKKLLLGMAAFGLAFCLWIAYIELVQLRVICPVCIMCQAVMIGVFSLAAIVNKGADQKQSTSSTESM